MSFSSPSPQRVLRALCLFLEQPTPQILKSNWDLLSSKVADQKLAERITLIEKSQGPGEAVTTKFFRWFLRRARQLEPAVASEELSYLTNLKYRESFGDLCEILAGDDTWREKRCKLEKHPELLAPELEKPLKIYAILIEQNPEMITALSGRTAASDRQKMKRIGNDLYLLLEALHEARERGGRAEDIRWACVNYFGGLALDAPPEFIKEEQRYFDLLHQAGNEPEDQQQARAQRQGILEKLIETSQGKAEIAPETLAELRLHLIREMFFANLYAREQKVYENIIQLQQEIIHVYSPQRYPYRFALAQKCLGDISLRFVREGRRQHLEKAIRCYCNTIEIATKERSPLLWAETQVDLAHAYRERTAGTRLDNMELSKEAAEAALQVFTRQDFPDEWASAQHTLANAYFFRMKGEKADNIERAIMHYYLALQEVKPDKHPHSWGTSHFSLGNCYDERIEGSRKDNLEQAITHLEMAEQVFTDERFRLDWAMVQSSLGNTYMNRIEGNLRDNIERAIFYFQNALTVFTDKDTPKEWTAVQQSLGAAYWRRLAGARNENLEHSIHHLEEAERVCPRREDPYHWALLQFNLGNAYSDRLEGKRQENLLRAIRCYQAASQVWKRATYEREWALARHHLGSAYNHMQDEERAIICYKEVLQYYTRENHPYDWAGLQYSLATAYRDRTKGNARKNIYRAITHLKNAQEVLTRQEYPIEWAGIQEIMGGVYLRRPDTERQENVQEALACYKNALQVYTKNGFLRGQRSVLMSLGGVEVEQAHWGDAHTYFKRATNIESILSQLSAGAMGRDLIRRQTADASTRDAYALVRLGNYVEAAEAIEQGRARDLAEGLRLNTDHPERIADPDRRKRYGEAKKARAEAQGVLDAPPSEMLLKGGQETRNEAKEREQHLKATEDWHKADEQYWSVVKEIQEREGVDVLGGNNTDAATIREIAGRIGPQHALVYLVATPWGGFALAVQDTEKSAETGFFVVDLPQLTTHLLVGLLDTRLQDSTHALVGGYAYAQQDTGTTLLMSWLQQGKTLRQAATFLHEQCMKNNQQSTLDQAFQKALMAPELAALVDLPLDEMDKKTRNTIMGEVEQLFLHYELERCFETLGSNVLAPLMAALREHAVASLTLIPCGWLAAFPLTAVSLEDGRTVGETLPTSTAPSARALQQYESNGESKRTSVYAIGDPTRDLAWGEAEAHAVASLAQSLGLGHGPAAVQDEAMREKLIEALQSGLVVDVSCHGSFDNEDFRRTRLSLIDQPLYLGELLSHAVDLRGLRLLILSACQTAVLDLNGAVNEVRSLSSGVLQAGAQSVLASLWSVNDYTTYLLIVYFARLWLPSMKSISPAAALAKAQRWLRNVTWGELQQELSKWDASSMKRGTRYEHAEAVDLLRRRARKQDPGLRPFESPFYWAGFQVTGW